VLCWRSPAHARFSRTNVPHQPSLKLLLLFSWQVLRYGASRRDAAQLAPAALQAPPPEPTAANPLDPAALAAHLRVPELQAPPTRPAGCAVPQIVLPGPRAAAFGSTLGADRAVCCKHCSVWVCVVASSWAISSQCTGVQSFSVR
jgi:hypothetical protein